MGEKIEEPASSGKNGIRMVPDGFTEREHPGRSAVREEMRPEVAGRDAEAGGFADIGEGWAWLVLGRAVRECALRRAVGGGLWIG